MQSLGAVAQFSDDFSDGAFTGDSRSVNWSGDVDSFTVNSSEQLQVNASGWGALTVQLRTPSTIARGGEWTFAVKMDLKTPDPSTTNYVRVFLTSEDEDLIDPNGFFVRIGGSDDDNISLWQANKGKANKSLIAGVKDRVKLKTFVVQIRATWESSGRFTLRSKLEGEDDWTVEGTKDISDIPTANYFGVVCYGTKTNNVAYSFDDFVVKAFDASSTGITPVNKPDALWVEYPSGGNEQYGIHYQLDRAGYSARLFIYDMMGRRVETVLNNEVLGSRGVIYRNLSGNLNHGVYIAYLEVFDALGNVQQFKKPIVVK
ncbi:hypothetical protein AGMMS49982_01060 [Bacteroidia bacterium]|nr:hypothetical protein AGMMS49982_01060 [Bacteroidia bacterium]